LVRRVRLPEAHPVLKILAAISVRGYLKGDKYKFAKAAKEIPGFASDLLEAVKFEMNYSTSVIIDDYSCEGILLL
jgi:hypothetical protein